MSDNFLPQNGCVCGVSGGPTRSPESAAVDGCVGALFFLYGLAAWIGAALAALT